MRDEQQLLFEKVCHIVVFVIKFLHFCPCADPCWACCSWKDSVTNDVGSVRGVGHQLHEDATH